MGLLHDLAKIADKGLQAVESGAVEKTLAGAIDKLESGLDKAVESAEKAAAMPEKLLETAEQKQQQVTELAQNVQKHAARTITIVQQ